MQTPVISLCMIVRDEAQLLPQFLQAARGVWDELCVVDTGSKDATPALLTAAGARLIHRAWDGDFAAARNAGLEAAAGTWILVLDADEMVSPEFVAAVRRVSCSADAGAAALTMHHDLPHGHFTQSYLLRMFRAHKSVRYTGTIHEDVVHAVLAQLRVTGQRLVHLRGRVEHLGYTQERARSRNKKQRDLQGLRACVDRNSQDLYSWYKMLELARFWRDTALWTDVAYEADAHLCAAEPQAVARAWFIGELVCMLAEGMYGGNSQQMLHYLAPWEAHIQPSAAYFLRRGELHEVQGEVDAAERDFRRCVALRHVTANVQLAGVRPLLGLSRLAMVRQDWATAFECLDTALTDNHRDPEALLALVTLTLHTGGTAVTRQVVDAYRASHGDTEELRAALGEAALRAGDAVQAIEHLQIAQTLSADRGSRVEALLAEARDIAAR